MNKFLIISILLSPFCTLNYYRHYQNGGGNSGWEIFTRATTNHLQSIHFNYKNNGYDWGNCVFIFIN